MAMDPDGWEVTADQDLLGFLRPYEAWRADWLIRCGLVTVQHRSGAREKLDDPRFQLFKGEKIFVPIGVPEGGTVRDVMLPEKCRGEMEKDASARAVDFVFQPHKSVYEDNMTDVLRAAHPDLRKIDADDLATFLARLRKYHDAAPVGTIHLIAHGSTDGNVNVKIRPQRPGKKHDSEITYESLDEAAKEVTPIKAYPPLFLPPRPIDPDTRKARPAALRIRACRAGVHKILLAKLKEALGPGIDVVSAPLFMQGAATVRGKGLIEYLRHEFTLPSREKLARPLLIERFRKGYLAFAPGLPVFFDGTAVPPLAWERWIPRQLRLATDYGFEDTENLRVVIPVPGPSRLRVNFRWIERSVDFELDMSAEKPKSPAAALAAFATHVNARGASSKWSDRHPFPMSARLGYSNLEELMKGFEWKVTEIGSGQSAFTFTATRQEYTVLTPLMRGANLLCNFYSQDPKIPSLRTFRDDDPKYFTNV